MTNDADVQRFYRVLWPERAGVLRTAYFLCRDASEAEDLAQDVFLKALSAIDQLTDDAGARPWLMTILRHTRIDRLRSRAAHPTLRLEAAEFEPALPEAPSLPPTDSTAEALLEALSDETIIKALQELPEEIRWTLLLVDVHGMEHAEAAQIQGVPMGTIKSRAHRGREMLRQTLLESPVSVRRAI